MSMKYILNQIEKDIIYQGFVKINRPLDLCQSLCPIMLRNAGIRTFRSSVPKALELIVSTALASFLMRSDYFYALSRPLVPTVSVYSGRQSRIICGQKITPHKRQSPCVRSFCFAYVNLENIICQVICDFLTNDMLS